MWPKLMLIVVYAAMPSAKELTYYVDFEHPNVTYCNRKYVVEAKITAQRYSRRDPIHYVNMHFKTLVDFGNEVRFDVLVYEFLSNEYRPSILDVHFRTCEIFQDTKFDVLKPIYLKYVNASLCPFPKGQYNYINISVPNLPLLATFPLRKGRLFVNTTNYLTGERIGAGYVDTVIKQRFQ